MNTFSVTYTIKFELKNNAKYKFTKCGVCYNSKTGRVIRQVYSNGSIGYCINGKFRSLKSLRKELVKLKKPDTPF